MADFKQTFDFELGGKVKLTLSAEAGEVIGRAQYTYAEPSYLVRYVAADGRQVENWQTETALSANAGGAHV